MEFSLFELAVLALASFRLTRLLVYDKITEFIRRPFFDEVKELDSDGESEIYLIPKNGVLGKTFGELLSCYWCTGMWSSLFLYLLYFFYPAFGISIIFVLAIAGLAAIIETILQRFINE